MGRITSNTGLITGLPITDTVDQLIAVAGAPRDLLTSRNQGLQQQQLAINSLSTRVLSLQFDLSKLSVSDPFQAREVASQDESLITAVLNESEQPPVGSFQIRPAQTASSQQLISQRFETLDDIQSTGSLNFGFGGFVDKGISLDELNDGSGVARGEIQITDRNGNSSVIDLSLARTVDDVLDTINADTTINVTASVDGDTFVLNDNTGGTGTLTVQEVNGGTTAEDLGLDENAVDSTISGRDVFGLHADTKLTSLNDGNGVRLVDGDDLTFILRTEDTFSVDLGEASTLGDVIDAINNDEDNGGRVTASISSDGNRIELTDVTGGSAGNFIVSSTTGSAAEDLGIVADVATNSITGERITSGLRDTLLSSLNGGAGLGELGTVTISDKDADGSELIDLSSAETLQDVVDLLNSSSEQIEARINTARNGIEVEDQSGGSGFFIISGDSATALGISVFNDSVSSVNGGALGRQTLSEATLLSSLNGGEGITASDIKITDSNGESTSIDLNATGSEAQTIGDVIDAINAAEEAGDIGVRASINSTGDGLLITDTALGSQTLGISDINGTLAADLNLTRASETVEIEGQDTQVIDGTSSYSIDLTNVDGDSSSILLSSLNDGAGINFSDIRITDSRYDEEDESPVGITVLDLNGADAGITTIGQLIDRINEEAADGGANVTASINDSGTGIQIVDNSSGAGTLTIEDINGTAAADLKILTDENTTDTVDGIGLFSAQSASQGALEAVADQINDLDAGVSATAFFDGVGYRLSITVDETGSANEILLDAGDSGFEFTETSTARDALIILGDQGIAGSGVLISSSTNDFNEVIAGVDLSIDGISETAVSVDVTETDSEIISVVQGFVDSYNALRSDLDSLTEFDEDDLTTGLLFGTNEALRVDTELSRLLTDRYTGLGSFESLAEIGLTVDDSGQLELDTTKLKEAFAEDAKSLQSLFTDENQGVVAQFETAIDRLAGAENGLLTNRSDSLQATIDTNTARIEDFNESLERQREALLLQFYQLETVIASLQENQSALESLQPLAPLVSVS